MPTTFDERVATVQRLTRLSLESPRRYRGRVVFWIVLGYAIIASLVAVSLALSAGAFALLYSFDALSLFYFAWIPATFAWMLARALFVRLDLPDGREIDEPGAPRLFAMVEDLRARARAGRIDRVLLVGDMNAAVAETPRFGGILGWRRHLLIGLPLLLSHSTDEVRAVLAHELGHLSHRHGRIAAWSWRVRETWSRIVASVEQRGDVVARALQKLFHWYVERLNPATFVQARAHELDADRFAAEATSGEIAARALAWHTVADTLMTTRFWEPLWKSVEPESDPPAPFSLLAATRGEVLAPPYADILDAELARATAIDDTHPSLRERLERFGHERPRLGLTDSPAAGELLRDAAAMIEEFDRLWIDSIRPLWESRRGEVEAARRALEPEIGELAAADPAALHAQKGDLAGIAFLSRAIERDWQSVLPACELAYTALREKGMEKDAAAWIERYQLQCALLNEAEREARRLTTRDTFQPTQLSDDVQRTILDRCRDAGWVSSVWIARKELRAIPTSVEFVAVTTKSYRFQSDARFARLVESLSGVPDLMIFLVSSGSLIRRLDKLPGARKSLRR